MVTIEKTLGKNPKGVLKVITNLKNLLWNIKIKTINSIPNKLRTWELTDTIRMKLQPSWNIISRESLRCTDIDFIFDFTQSSHLIVEHVGANVFTRTLDLKWTRNASWYKTLGEQNRISFSKCTMIFLLMMATKIGI